MANGVTQRDNDRGAPPSASGERSTRQKRALAALLAESVTFRSAQDLFAELRMSGERVGLTTIYNQLGALTESREVDVVHTNTGELLYRRCQSDSHHHHLVCRSCARAVEIAVPAVERLTHRIGNEHGFTDLSHTIEIYGLCPDCGKS